MGDRALPLQSGEPIIAVEEHYWDAELAATFPPGRRGAERLEAKLRDFGAARIKAMGEAGIDMQILSHGSPSTQVLPADVAVALSRRVNDRLHTAIEAFPERLAGFAALPTADPTAAADELERTVPRLGFKGAMIHGLANGLFLDHQRFWPIFERAERLGVPIYMHPSVPHPAVVDAYYKEYVDAFPTVVRAAWGFTVETATQALRLVLSGLFEAYPRLTIVLGHLGETLPFLLWRIDEALARPGQKTIRFREIFSQGFYVTTSGFFSTPALNCCIEEMGAERVLFAVDYPYIENASGAAWLRETPIAEADRAKIAGGNAKRLFRL
jgi:predicted TIM-barrel fold metal-dependent hydrolase